MRIFFTLIPIFLLTFQLFAQERTISGTLTSNDGSPLPGINIVIKGTSIGTVTDINGYYSINVPVGATLVFSFVGMSTQEIVVTDDNFRTSSSKKNKLSKKQKPPALQPIPRTLYKDTVAENTPGVSVFTDKTPSHAKGLIDPSDVRSIKKHRKGYAIVSDSDPVKRSGMRLQFSTSFGIDRINKLPSFQNQYAQGQPQNEKLTWRGPDQHEIYSWGPLIRTLEFDGSSYPYDKNGRLVPKTTGSGKEAIAYDPVSFFRTGTSSASEWMIFLAGPKRSTFIFDVENRNRKSVVPNSWFKEINFSASLKDFHITDRLKAAASASYCNSKGNLLSRGANLASIVGGVYRTPLTFDNANGFPSKNAYEFPESYQLSDGTKRSHAPGVADNPNGLVGELPDHEKLQRLLASLNLQYHPKSKFDFNFNGNVDHQSSENVYGIPPGYSGYVPGRLTQRQDDQTFVNAILTSSYAYDDGWNNFKVGISYQNQYIQRELYRVDGFDFENNSWNSIDLADSTVSLNKITSRSSHEIIVNAQYERGDWLNVRFSNRNYFSSTINSAKYTNIFPTGSVSINLRDLLFLDVKELKLYGSLSRTLREGSLIYSDWAYSSTQKNVENYNAVFEETELFFESHLLPETERKFETGIKFSALNECRIDLAYFNNRTENFIAPIWDENHFRLQNIGVVKNYGGTVSIAYYHRFGTISWDTKLEWSKYNSIAQEVYAQDRIALSGFKSAQSVMAAGQPVGAIYGSTYQRNGEGEMIIGSDGFPLEDLNYKIIGNPTQDWTLGWSSRLYWREFQLSFLFDFKRGGDVWNGTHAILDYLGKSSSTGELRNISNYVFEGVDVGNNPNIIPVNFADPTKPVDENRWVRYGWDGVGEDYIEDASWIRLNEVTLSYTINRYQNHAVVKAIIFSLVGNNLFLITPYSGVDPSSTLFGYNAGNGLDLFNAPATRRYNAQITIKI